MTFGIRLDVSPTPTVTGGYHRNKPSPAELDEIFAPNIVRLIGNEWFIMRIACCRSHDGQQYSPA